MRWAMPLHNATIRIFKPLCDKTDGCTLPPMLRAETQSDDKRAFPRNRGSAEQQLRFGRGLGL